MTTCKTSVFLDLKSFNAQIPPAAVHLFSVTSIKLSRNKFDTLKTLQNASASWLRLTKLDASQCIITSLPRAVANLESLKYFDLSSNHFTAFPEHLELVHSLEEIKLDDNFVRTVPPLIRSLTALKKLTIRKNKVCDFWCLNP